jgi:acyl-coenzyme A synthetase/AMP-(fatty) acid ligase
VVTLAKRMRRLSPGSMPGLRWSLFAGEQLTRDQADAWERAAPNSTVENLYGPTELTITCVGYRVPADRSRRTLTHNGTVPIGDPHPLVDHVLIGEDGRPGEQGELCVRGPQRFAGYLRSADNAGRFVRLDDGVARGYDGAGTVGAELYYRTGDLVSRHPDGMLVHHGRLDNQVKLHGYRVELGEIEAALRTHPRVEDAVVLVPDGSADPVGCYTGEEVAGPELVAALQSRLPWYMVPSQYRHVDGMPLNANGKVDRRALVEALPSSKEGSHDR